MNSKLLSGWTRHFDIKLEEARTYSPIRSPKKQGLSAREILSVTDLTEQPLIYWMGGAGTAVCRKSETNNLEDAPLGQQVLSRLSSQLPGLYAVALNFDQCEETMIHPRVTQITPLSKKLVSRIQRLLKRSHRQAESISKIRGNFHEWHCRAERRARLIHDLMAFHPAEILKNCRTLVTADVILLGTDTSPLSEQQLIEGLSHFQREAYAYCRARLPKWSPWAVLLMAKNLKFRPQYQCPVQFFRAVEDIHFERIFMEWAILENKNSLRSTMQFLTQVQAWKEAYEGCLENTTDAGGF